MQLKVPTALCITPHCVTIHRLQPLIMDFPRRMFRLALAVVLAGTVSACDMAEQNYDAQPGNSLDIEGSTEVIVGDGSGHGPEAISFRHSFNIGTVRLTERFFAQLPPSSGAVERAETFIRQQIETVAIPIDGAMPVLGNSGTAMALALVNAGPESAWADLDADQHILSAADVRHWRERLLGCSTAEVMALHPQAMQGRADVFPMGVLILDVLLRAFGSEAFRVSPYQLRHGLLLRHLRARSAAEK